MAVPLKEICSLLNQHTKHMYGLDVEFRGNEKPGVAQAKLSFEANVAFTTEEVVNREKFPAEFKKRMNAAFYEIAENALDAAI